MDLHATLLLTQVTSKDQIIIIIIFFLEIGFSLFIVWIFFPFSVALYQKVRNRKLDLTKLGSHRPHVPIRPNFGPKTPFFSQFHQQLLQDMLSSTISLKPNSNFSPRIHLFPPKFDIAQPKSRMASLPSFLGGLNLSRVAANMGVDASSAAASSDQSSEFCTLMEYVGKGGIDVGDGLVVLLGHLEYASKKIAALVASPFNSSLGKNVTIASTPSERDEPKPLDIVSV